MEIGLRFILTTCIVNILLTFVPVLNEAVLGSIHDAGNVQKNIENLFDSVARNTFQRSDTIRDSLKHDVEKEQEAFDTMKVEWWISRNRNTHQQKNEGENVVMVKRETNEENYDPKTRWRDGRYRDGRDLFQGPNPFNKRRWELSIPKKEDLNNATYQAGMEEVLKLWFQQRYNLEQVFRFKHNISCMLPDLKMYAFDTQLKSSQDLIDRECLVIQNILWGEKKEYRTPLDKTLIRRFASEIKLLQSYIEEENLPEAVKNGDKYIQEDLAMIRGYLKKSLEFLTSHYARIGETIELWESGAEGAVTPMKWVQMKHHSTFGNHSHGRNHPHQHDMNGFDFDADNDSADETVEWVHDPRLVSDPTYHNLIEMVLQLWWAQRAFIHNVRHETEQLKTLKSVTMREVDDKVNEIDVAVEGQIDSMSLWDNTESVDLNRFMNETVHEEMLRKWTAADQSFRTYQIDNAAEICSRLRHQFKAAREDLSHRWQRVDTMLCELTEQEQQRRAEEEEKEQQQRKEEGEEEENKCEP